MHDRISYGWRSFGLTVAVLSLLLVPFTAALAEAPTSVVDRGDSSLGLAENSVEGPRSSVETYARANYAWPYASGPFYGKVPARMSREAGVLHTAVGSFVLSEAASILPAELKSGLKLGQVQAQYFVVQFDKQNLQADSYKSVRQIIESAGGAVVGHLPVTSMIARLNSEALSSLQSRFDVLDVQPYQPAFKLHPSIGRNPLADPAKAMSEIYELEIMLFPGENAEVVAQSIAAFGGNVTKVWSDTIRAEVHRTKLAQVAALEPVQMVNEFVTLHPHAEETTTTVQTGRYRNGAIPYHDAGVDGGGNGIASEQIIMVLDSGIQIDAGDLSDTRTNAGSPGAGHRKVISYASTSSFGGSGDLEGCDAPAQGGFTHGHIVSATALGNGTDVAPAYGTGWVAPDNNVPANTWKLDGVADGARLIAYDAQFTPPAVSCADPLQDTITPGDLYAGGTTGSLGQSYGNGARTVNFSWGADSNVYSSNSIDIDTFLVDKRDAMVFVSAGNAGQDADNDFIPDESSIGTPATSKNGLAIGASGGPDDLGGGLATQESRAGFSSVGPAAAFNRIAPQLMAPGQERGTMGVASEFACRTNDNDSNNPVNCDVSSGSAGTSFASPAAAGAGALVRDYFAQGFYPDGTSGNPGNAGDQVANVSGALVKATLIASADFMTGANLSKSFRGNFEQGWGRIQLDNVLPLQTWPNSASGLIVADGGIDGGIGNLSGLDGQVDNAQTDTATINVCDPSQEIRVALTWLDPVGDALVNDLDLEVISPSGKVYYGNYFTEDEDRDGILQNAAEDCPSPFVAGNPAGELDESQFSLPICVRGDTTLPSHDSENPIEAVVLSPDPSGAGGETPPFSQIELGDWTVRVIGADVPSGPQRYAVVVAGGVCLGSSVRFDTGTYVCNSLADITINETDEGNDPGTGLTTAEIASRVTVDVLENGIVVDTEPGSALGFTQPDPLALNFTAENLAMTDGTARDSGNGVLDVRSGDQIRVTYADEASGVADPDQVRQSFAEVDCTVRIGFGTITFGSFGQDGAFSVNGGCEINARGLREFGFPDKYMDAGEDIIFNFAFASEEEGDLENAEASLRCVFVNDALADEDCQPGDSTRPGCTNPDRTIDGGHADCGAGVMSILNSPLTIGLLPGGSAISANFAISMADVVTPVQPEVELVLELTAATSGKTAQGVAVTRQQVDVDENTTFYSTDFPTAGSEVWDSNNNELVESPTTNIGNFLEDYRFENRVYGDLTAGGTKNTGISPWNFDTNDGGFVSGLGATTDESTITDTIAHWGEDKNFNGVDDKRCLPPQENVSCVTKTDCNTLDPPSGNCVSIEDRDPANLTLDKSWSTQGGCGWQTKAPGTCSGNATQGCYTNDDCAAVGAGTCTGSGPATGGIWHTGRIRDTTSVNCLFDGNLAGQCQRHETVSGGTGQRTWFEILETPELQKVNGDDHKVEITNWAWNQSVDLADSNAFWTWEFDTDVASLDPVDTRADLTLLNFGAGAYGAVANSGNPDLSNGFSLFAALGRCSSNNAPCNDDTDCWPSGSTCLSAGGADINGTSPLAGSNREGDNNCFFATGTVSLGDHGLAGPRDDDTNNGFCLDPDPVLSISGINTKCTTDLDCTTAGFTGPCLFDNASVDEYVTTNGPIRNMDIFAFNGPDMRFSTLEDLFGDTGETFKGAIGMINFEKEDVADPDPAGSYGVGVDDMVVEWREFNLVADTFDCAATGSCATLDVQTTNFFEGNGVIEITAIDNSVFAATNDCNCDGVFDGTLDCDGDGATGDQIAVEVTSENEVNPGECVLLTATGVPGEYTGSIPISASYDVPGVLFIQVTGTDNPTVTVTYQDEDDGAGSKCKNDVDPAAQGQVQATTVVFVPAGGVILVNTLSSDNGDDDGFADTREKVQTRITLKNLTGIPLTNVVARLSCNDPNGYIACIVDPTLIVGDMGVDEVVLSAADQYFEYIVSPDADRSDLGLTDLDELSVECAIVIQADEIASTDIPQSVIIDLDLTASGGGSPSAYFEGFEVASGLASFTTQNLDFGLNSIGASDGARCQYSDPDWSNSNSYGSITDCFVGATPAQADAYFWQVHQPSAIDGGKAYEGTRSLYMGIFGPAADEHTTPMANLEGVRTNNPINIAWDKVCNVTRLQACADNSDCPGGEECVGVNPELSFKHQIDFMDSRTVNVSVGESADRGIVAIQLANGAGAAVGSFEKLQPYQNLYDQQGTDNYTNCLFDPTDDGNTEDDFFDPGDPDRRLGPSSTCFPEFSFTYLGDTFNPFTDATVGLGNAEGPGEGGSLGIGTWVESKFNLDRYRGRRVRVRFANTALKAGAAETYEQIFEFNPSPGDDGWWIDNISIRDTVTTPASVNIDNNPNTTLPTCASFDCITAGGVTVDVQADPGTTLPTPGQRLELDAGGSDASCPDGVLQYRFRDGATVLRDWSDNPVFVVAPTTSGTYSTDVRCSSDTDCTSTTDTAITVDCPSSGLLGGLFPAITATATNGSGSSDATLGWGSSENAVYAQGCLENVSAYTNTATGPLTGAATLDISGDDPLPCGADALWYLLRKSGEFCNDSGPWTSGGAQELAGRDDPGALP